MKLSEMDSLSVNDIVLLGSRKGMIDRIFEETSLHPYKTFQVTWEHGPVSHVRTNELYRLSKVT